MLHFDMAGAIPVDSASVCFEEGRYDDAISLWEAESKQHPSAAIFYNIGLAYQKSGKPLEAIYSFEQALRYKPWSAAIRDQLNTIRSGIKDPVIAATPFFLQVWLHTMVAILRPGAWAMIGLLILAVLVIHFISLHKPTRIKPFLFGRMPLLLAMIGMVAFACSVFSYARLAASDESLTTALCEVRQGPAQKSPVVLSLSAGEKVIVLDAIGSWRYVKLSNLDKGWMPSACLKTIQLPGY